MKKILLFAVLLFFMKGMVVHAQETPCSYAKDNSENRLDINNVDAPFKPQGGAWFFNENGADYFVPKGTDKSPLFCYSLWMGAFDDTDSLHLFGEQYNQSGHDTWPGPLSMLDATIDEATMQQWNRTFKITRQEVTDFLANRLSPDYTIPQHILDWPAHGDTSKGQAWMLAPFVDSDNDGTYRPENGDYPDFPGDMAQFLIFNDNYAPHAESGGAPLGIEAHVMAYAYNVPEDTLVNNTIFLKYKIFNRSQNNYQRTYVGFNSDWDVGYGGDDYVGCDVMKNAVFGYNGREIDGSGLSGHYGSDWPVQTLRLLSGPLMPADGIDNPAYEGPDNCPQGEFGPDWYAVNGTGFGDGIEDNERYGLTNFISYNNDYTTTGEPHTAIEHYNLMRGIWIDNLSLHYGANGHPMAGATGPGCHFMCPGMTDPCNFGTYGMDPNPISYGADGWTEAAVGNAPADRRGLASVGPFNMDAGSVQEFELCLVTVPHNWAVNENGSITLDSLVHLSETFPSLGMEEYTPMQNLKIYPNPTTNHVYVEMGANWENFKSKYVLVYDLHGKCVLRQSVTDTSIQIDMSNYPSGFYLIRIGNSVGKVIKQ